MANMNRYAAANRKSLSEFEEERYGITEEQPETQSGGAETMLFITPKMRRRTNSSRRLETALDRRCKQKSLHLLMNVIKWDNLWHHEPARGSEERFQ